MPLNDAAWKERELNLTAAREFAEYLNTAPKRIGEDFFRYHPDFLLPSLSWTHDHKMHTELWDRGFPQELVVDAISDTGIGTTMTTTLHHDDGQIETKTRKVADVARIVGSKRAILFLFTERWRAKKCRLCGKRFVAEKPGARFCSSGCATDHRESYKKENWKKIKDRINADRREEYRTQHPKKRTGTPRLPIHRGK